MEKNTEENTAEETNSQQTLDVNSQNVHQSGSKLWLYILIGVVILGLLIAGCVFLFSSEAAVTSKIRDVFIIFMALEFLVIGVALIILIIQIAILTNLLQNEVRPILHSTSDTVNTLKGTVKFLSDNMTEPVIKLNSSIASLNKLVGLFKFKK